MDEERMGSRAVGGRLMIPRSALPSLVVMVKSPDEKILQKLVIHIFFLKDFQMYSTELY